MQRDPAPQLASAELSVLGPLAGHRFLTLPQLAVLLGVAETTATRRCRRLADARLLVLAQVFHKLPAAAMITAGGLAALGSRLGPPVLNLAEYRHDVGVGWLWLAARAGRFGEPQALLTERLMQAQDDALAAAREPPGAGTGIGIGVFGAGGRPRRHYPDLLIALRGGGHVAVELELTGKNSQRMVRIMSAYASDARITKIVYMAGSDAIARIVQRAAARAEIAERTHIRLVAADGIAGAAIAGRQRQRRARTRAPASSVIGR